MIIEKAMINSSIYLHNSLVLPFAPDRLRRIYYEYFFFFNIRLSLFIVDYDNITDDDIFIIFVYYGIIFNDSA